MKHRNLAWLGLLVAAAAAAQELPAPRGTRHALVIGVGEYSVPTISALKGVATDVQSARQMARAMAIPETQITVLRDRDATADRIRAEIRALDARVADGDRVFIYYSGHGTRWYDERLRQDGCTEGLMASDGRVLSNVELGRSLAPLARRTDKMLVFYDACFSGGVAEAPTRTRAFAGQVLTPKFVPASAVECSKPTNYRKRDLAQVLQQDRAMPENVVHVAASRSDEVSFDTATGGVATTAWRDCLLGEARDSDGSGAVSVDEVTACAQAKVSRALAGLPDISGQQLTVTGNRGFVPAWMGAAFAAPPAPAPASAALPATLPTAVVSAPITPAPLPASAPALAAPVASPAPLQAATPAQMLAEVHRQRDGARPLALTLARDRLRIGVDPLSLTVTSPRDGHLYLVLAGSDGQSLYLLYPNELARDNRVRAGQAVTLPGPSWEIVAGGPPGTETVLALVTDAPRDLGGLAAEKTGPFMKTLLDGQGRARLQAVLANGTPAAGCGKPGAPSCSDAFAAALVRVESVK